MAFEDITGTRYFWTDYVGGTIGAASTIVLNALKSYIMPYPFTITALGVAAGTTNPAGSQAGSGMGLRVWVNGTRKGNAIITLAPAGIRYNERTSLVFTGPANSTVALSISSAGSSVAGVGARYLVKYVHGHKGTNS